MEDKMRKPGIMRALVLVLGISLLAGAAWAADPPKIEWELAGTWNSPEPPIDIARSLSSSLLFILTKEGDVKVFGPGGVDRGAIPVGKGVTRIEVSPDDSMMFAINSTTGEIKLIDIYFRKKINTKGSPILGKASAPVEIVVFSDYFCPSCAGFMPTVRELNHKFPNQVKFVFKQYPIGKGPLTASKAALAADKQKLFWPLHQKLFANVDKLKDKKDIYGLAREVGLDMPAFKVDLAGKAVANQLSRDEEDGEMAGLTGVPAVFVNGRQVWNRSPRELTKVIKQELKAKK